MRVCVCLFVRSKEPLKDSVVSTYEEHEDSVYAAEWSSADPWLFASLSYDGRLVINRVPRALKYRILLWEDGEGQVICMYMQSSSEEIATKKQYTMAQLSVLCKTLQTDCEGSNTRLCVLCKYTVGPVFHWPL